MRVLILFSIALFFGKTLFAQTQTNCTLNFPNNFAANYNFSSFNMGACPSGDVIFTNANSNNGGAGTVTFNQSITLNSLDVTFSNGNNPLEIIVPEGVTLTITNDIDFSVNSTPQGKFLTVDGTLIVGGNVDFGDINFEIDGTGSISAGSITGAGNTTCEGVGTCPDFDVDTCTGGGLCNEEALPITLVSFSALTINERVSLNWSTAKEEDFSHFEIERSVDGGKNFAKIGVLEGAGHSVSLRSYSFVDHNAPFGIIYYRLNAVDLDGSFEYSPIISITKGLEGLLTAYPNPTESKRIYIKVPDAFGDTFQRLEFYSLAGERMMQLTDLRVESEILLPSHIPAGIYLMNVVHNGLVENIKVLVK